MQPACSELSELVTRFCSTLAHPLLMIGLELESHEHFPYLACQYSSLRDLVPLEAAVLLPFPLSARFTGGNAPS